MPRISLILLGLILLGLVVAPTVGPGTVGRRGGGAVVLAIRAIMLKQVKPTGDAGGDQPAVPDLRGRAGRGGGRRDQSRSAGRPGNAAARPERRCSPLLALAVIAAVLANLINNLPATLVLLAALGSTPAAGAVLAILIGVNVGPNLTYTGSLATLLWRRVLHAKGHRPVARPVHRARPADRARLPAARHRRAMGGAHAVLTPAVLTRVSAVRRAGPAPPSRWSG